MKITDIDMQLGNKNLRVKGRRYICGNNAGRIPKGHKLVITLNGDCTIEPQNVGEDHLIELI